MFPGYGNKMYKPSYQKKTASKTHCACLRLFWSLFFTPPLPYARYQCNKGAGLILAPMAGKEVSLEDIYLNPLCQFSRFYSCTTDRSCS